MPLLVNLRHLEEKDLHLQGELPVEELELELRDDLVRVHKGLQYDVQVQKMEASLLIQGKLLLPIECHCVRCLKPFEYRLELQPWTRHLSFEGEEKAAIVGDCVDLTPYVREDILLEFPQHPLCEADCPGLPGKGPGKSKKSGGSSQTEEKSSAWSELDKLKF